MQITNLCIIKLDLFEYRPLGYYIPEFLYVYFQTQPQKDVDQFIYYLSKGNNHRASFISESAISTYQPALP